METLELQARHHGTTTVVRARCGTNLRESVLVHHGWHADATAHRIQSAAATLRQRMALIIDTIREVVPFGDRDSIRVERISRRVLRITSVTPRGELVADLRCHDTERPTRRLRRKVAGSIRLLLERTRAMDVQLGDGALNSNIIIEPAACGTYRTIVEGREILGADLGVVMRSAVRRALRFGRKVGVDTGVFADLTDVAAYTDAIQRLSRQHPTPGADACRD
ncbi:MAG: hypothetical protein AB7K09_13120 [Planctomycetota bacterium]